MTWISRIALIVGLAALLAGCSSGWPRPLAMFDRSSAPAPAVETPTEDPAQDASIAEDPAEADADAPADETPVAAGVLGETIASLGDPTNPGLWLETPLVNTETLGRIAADNGRTASVTLRPSGGVVGSGSRISLAAMQALGLSLTDLPTLTVIAGQ